MFAKLECIIWNQKHELKVIHKEQEIFYYYFDGTCLGFGLFAFLFYILLLALWLLLAKISPLLR